MQVSIIIINYNTFELTCQCLRSVFEKTTGISFEVILVDNASVETDPERFRELFPAIKLIKSPVNTGFSRGNNLGIEQSSGEYILLLNSDTELLTDSISFIYHRSLSLQNLGAATVQLIYPDGEIQQAANKFPSVWLHFLVTSRLFHVFKSHYRKQTCQYDYTKSFSPDWIWGAFFFFPRKNLSLMGGKLKETFFMYYEDVEWCFLFKKHGLQNYYFAEAPVVHYVGKSMPSEAKQKMMRASFVKFIRVYYGPLAWMAKKTLLATDKAIDSVRNLFSKKKSITTLNSQR